ncbi:hypothetical protein XSR1_100072 [Xenorhabdus szentirmaii DSM 16338]|uniref:Uncharacterized protein n=1 Tax=Xenorhabdus szentirmaii DSM 16338 TaxID=1427518 RepID=W1IUZ3_9GAMM|nr:hypothetical protein XSR1_100072 [Xenorhabdus szentirmaii DSM 16338]
MANAESNQTRLELTFLIGSGNQRLMDIYSMHLITIQVVSHE